MRNALLLLLASTLLAACQPHNLPAQSDYQTVGKVPNRDTDKAQQSNDEALKLLDKKDYAGAERLLKQALAQDVMFGPAHNNLGLLYFRQSKLYLAAWEFQYATKLMPGHPEARNNLGLVFEASGKLEQAIGSYEEAMKAEPDNAQFVGNLARARIRRGDSDTDVRPLLEKLVAIDTRPDWTHWAREKLALGATAPTTGAAPRQN